MWRWIRRKYRYWSANSRARRARAKLDEDRGKAASNPEVRKSAIDQYVPWLLDAKYSTRRLAYDRLLELWWEPSNDEEAAAFSVAGGYWSSAADKGPAAVTPLTIALRDWTIDDTIRRDRGEVAKALGKTGDPAAVEPLIGALRDPQTSFHAIQALSNLGDARAIEPFASVLANGTAHTAEQGCMVAQALAGYGDNRALDWAWEKLSDPSFAESRYIPARIISDMADERAIQRLVSLCDHPDEWIASPALHARAGLGDAAAIASLVADFDDFRVKGGGRDAIAATLLHYGDRNRIMGVPPFGKLSDIERAVADALASIQQRPGEIASDELSRLLDIEVNRVVHSWEEDPDPDVPHRFIRIDAFDCSALKHAVKVELDRRQAVDPATAE